MHSFVCWLCLPCRCTLMHLSGQLPCVYQSLEHFVCGLPQILQMVPGVGPLPCCHCYICACAALDAAHRRCSHHAAVREQQVYPVLRLLPLHLLAPPSTARGVTTRGKHVAGTASLLSTTLSVQGPKARLWPDGHRHDIAMPNCHA